MMYIENLCLFIYNIFDVIFLNIFYVLDEEYFYFKKLKFNRY